VIPRQRRHRFPRPARVYRAAGWRAACRVCRRELRTGDGRLDHGSVTAAFFAAELHLEHAHDAHCHAH
jgi:hypothetical protein